MSATKNEIRLSYDGTEENKFRVFQAITTHQIIIKLSYVKQALISAIDYIGTNLDLSWIYTIALLCVIRILSTYLYCLHNIQYYIYIHVKVNDVKINGNVLRFKNGVYQWLPKSELELSLTFHRRILDLE